MNDRLLSLLGLCRRAGKLVIGFDPVKESIETGKAEAVFEAKGISLNTQKKIRACAEGSPGLRYMELPRTKDEVSFSIGKTCAVLAVVDKGFADKLCELVKAEQKEGGNNL